MDDRTFKILQELAANLDTTAEFLWGVLLRQAFISGIIDILQYCLIIGVSYAYYKWVVSEKRDFSTGGDSLPVAWVLGALLAVLLIIMFFAFPNTITNFANPDYSALKSILSAIKK